MCPMPRPMLRRAPGVAPEAGMLSVRVKGPRDHRPPEYRDKLAPQHMSSPRACPAIPTITEAAYEFKELISSNLRFGGKNATWLSRVENPTKRAFTDAE